MPRRLGAADNLRPHPKPPVSCPACAHVPVTPCFVAGDYTVARCSQCGLYVNQTFYDTPEFRASLFGQNYYDSNVAFDHRQQQYVDDPSMPFYSHYLGMVEQHVPPGRILDVGCAFGNFLRLAQDHGWSPHGVELSPYSSEVARNTWGFDVFTGDLDDCPYDAGRFDLVTFWDVLEHVPAPRRNLERARRLLRDGGYVLLATDNAAGLMARLGEILYRGTFGLWRYPVRKFFVRFNSCYFTAQDLQALLDGCGFATRHVVGVDYPLAKLNVSGWERQLVRLLYGLGRLLHRQSQFLVIAEAV